MASQAGYFNAAGGYYTFDPAVAEAIGGYPYGAILRWRDPATGAIRVVRSLKPDNTADFVADPNLIDDENWAFADDFAPASCINKPTSKANKASRSFRRNDLLALFLRLGAAKDSFGISPKAVS